MLVEDDFPLRCNVASSGGQLESVDTNVVENRCFTFSSSEWLSCTA